MSLDSIVRRRRTRLFSWRNRESDLKGVKRYGRFSVMFYRTNLFIHSQRVSGLLEALLPLATTLYKGLDPNKARLIAKHHDDFELIMGDVPLQQKLLMNEDQLSDLNNREVLAAEAISRGYPKKVRGFDYQKLLFHAIRKDCLESQLVSLADKIDGWCEAIHEVLADNIVFLEAVINYPLRTFNDLPGKYPLIREIFLHNHDLVPTTVVNLSDFFASGLMLAQLHTPEALIRDTGIPAYEVWKKVSVRSIGIDCLVNQIEFTPQVNNGFKVVNLFGDHHIFNSLAVKH